MCVCVFNTNAYVRDVVGITYILVHLTLCGFREEATEQAT